MRLLRRVEGPHAALIAGLGLPPRALDVGEVSIGRPFTATTALLSPSVLHLACSGAIDARGEAPQLLLLSEGEAKTGEVTRGHKGDQTTEGRPVGPLHISSHLLHTAATTITCHFPFVVLSFNAALPLLSFPLALPPSPLLPIRLVAVVRLCDEVGGDGRGGGGGRWRVRGSRALSGGRWKAQLRQPRGRGGGCCVGPSPIVRLCVRPAVPPSPLSASPPLVGREGQRLTAGGTQWPSTAIRTPPAALPAPACPLSRPPLPHPLTRRR